MANHDHGIDDPNIVYIVFAIADMVRAKAAINSEAKKKLMSSAALKGCRLLSFTNRLSRAINKSAILR